MLITRGTPFFGTETEDWNAWISRLETRASQLPVADKLQVLLGLLDGKALDVCSKLSPEEQKDYEKVKGTLETRFGAKIDTLQAFAAFSQATRQPGEDIETFGERLGKIARWTYQDQADTNDQVIQTIVNRFICGLQDPWLQRKLFISRPKDLDAAVQMVKELHQQQEIIASLIPDPGVTATAVTCPAPTGTGAGGGPPFPSRSGLYYGVQYGAAQPTPVTGLVAASHGHEEPTHGPSRTGPKCFGCGEMGHIRRFCTNAAPGERRAQKTMGNNGQGTGRPRSPWCLCCGKDGHWMADCFHFRGMRGNTQEAEEAGTTTRKTTTPSENW